MTGKQPKRMSKNRWKRSGRRNRRPDQNRHGGIKVVLEISKNERTPSTQETIRRTTPRRTY